MFIIGFSVLALMPQGHASSAGVVDSVPGAEKISVIASIALMGEELSCAVDYTSAAISADSPTCAELSVASNFGANYSVSFDDQRRLLFTDFVNDEDPRQDYRPPLTFGFFTEEAQGRVKQQCITQPGLPFILREGELELAYFQQDDRLEVQSSEKSAALYTGKHMSKPLPQTRSQLDALYEAAWGRETLVMTANGAPDEATYVRYSIYGQGSDGKSWLEIDTTGSPLHLPIAARWRVPSIDARARISATYVWGSFESRKALQGAIHLSHSPEGCSFQCFERTKMLPAGAAKDLRIPLLKKGVRIYDGRAGNRLKMKLENALRDDFIKDRVKWKEQ